MTTSDIKLRLLPSDRLAREEQVRGIIPVWSGQLHKWPEGVDGLGFPL